MCFEPRTAVQELVSVKQTWTF